MNLTDTIDSETDTSQLDAQIASVLTGADTQTAAGVTTLGLIQQARLSSQNRAASAATALYGAGSSQATAAGQVVAATQAASSRLTVMSQTVNTPQPTVALSGWALHGRVYDANLTPAASYTVFLVDAQKNYLDEYGFSYTDATGYFLINYEGSSASGTGGASSGSASNTPAPAPQKPPAASGGSSSVDQGGSRGGSADSGSSTPSSSASSQQIYLQVADADANPVLLSEVAFTPTTGQATYQIVTLPASGAKLGDPPAAIRAVALPPARTQTKENASQKTKTGSSQGS